MNSLHSSGLFWNFTLPHKVQEPSLVMFISDWIYGLLPYCGPGTRSDAWNREKMFQDEMCRFFNHLGIATISLDISHNDHTPPAENELIEISSVDEIISTLNRTITGTGCSIPKTVFFGHGFGTRLLCKLALSGLKPAGFILAAGLYSDTDTILNQKYLPFNTIENKINLSEINTMDPETSLILKNFGTILQDTRKGRERRKLKEGNVDLKLFLPKELYSFNTSSAFLLSNLNAPTLIIHGSGDLDIPVSNAFFLEQKLKQHISSVSRIVLFDCDHWFREMPVTSEDRITERLNGDCIHHKIDEKFFKNTQIFFQEVLKIGIKRVRFPINIPEPDGIVSSM